MYDPGSDQVEQFIFVAVDLEQTISGLLKWILSLQPYMFFRFFFWESKHQNFLVRGK